MVETKPDVPPSHDNPKVEHEPSDINVAGVVKFAACLVAFLLLVHLAVMFVFGRLDKKREQAQPKLSPLVQKERLRLPQDLDKIPEPRLQVNDIADMESLRKEEDAKLHRTGPVDAQGEFVHLPIDLAMHLLVRSEKARAAVGLRIRPKPRPTAQGDR